VIDVAHDRDDWRPHEHVGVDVGITFEADFHVGFRDAARPVAEFLDHEFGGIGVDRLGDSRHHAHLHQRFDNLRCTGCHAIGQFLHSNLFRQDNVAHDLDLIGSKPVQFCLTAVAVALTTNRRQRADFFILAFDRSLNVDTAGAAAIVGAALRRNDRRLASGNAAWTRAPDRTSFVLVFGTSSAQP
jgi:hypothetical protein